MLEGMRPLDLVVVEKEWGVERSVVMQELLRSSVPHIDWPQSLHWDWSKKAPELKLLESTGFGITFESKWQGVMLTKTASHVAFLSEDKGKPIVYIDYLEVAPWNWRIPELDREGMFRGIGSVLLWKAVKQSEEEGFHGRIGLHALSQAELFYKKAVGMEPLGPDPSKQGLLYFELSRQKAQSLLIRGDQS
jgi:hypothetical protein